MAKIALQHEVQGLSTSECYQVCLSALDLIGYKLFKKRDLANLIICNETTTGQKNNLSMMIPYGSPSMINLNLSSDELDEASLIIEAERILEIISSLIR